MSKYSDSKLSLKDIQNDLNFNSRSKSIQTGQEKNRTISLYAEESKANKVIKIERENIYNKKVFKIDIHPKKKSKEYKAIYPHSGIKKVDHRILMYNRVPKSGSETFTLLITLLSQLNDFKHRRSSIFNKRQLSMNEQRTFVREVMKRKPPFAYDRHIYFTNFLDFYYPNPIYINSMRDPVEKIISRFYFWRVPGIPVFEELKSAGKVNISKREWMKKDFEQCVRTGDPECLFITGQSYDLAIPYFCGHKEECMSLNNKAALQIAKTNVKKYYVVVGVLEELNKTLAVLEGYIPQFFKGASKLYSIKPKVQNKNFRKKKVSEEIKKILKKNLTMEYEFYEFIRKRLYDQFRLLKHATT
ncbi:heparan sulfate 2-O-sulfotransferase pipe-like isoform X2 [Limulus polyphemus]|uniref:Heparan sulfate 2-O-sulfotransferase pipe-like isoform X2 n=1 Tax=Limulus polyphemus TaxID=6850 RepID=A0ABM1TFF4_LIMPO|nr:heparan sulfate 2-O-sulfotransferase pipe-like isoform X2 [Limulus polyphemus]